MNNQIVPFSVLFSSHLQSNMNRSSLVFFFSLSFSSLIFVRVQIVLGVLVMNEIKKPFETNSWSVRGLSSYLSSVEDEARTRK